MKKNTMKRWLGILLAVVMIFTGSAYGLPNMANVVEAASAGANEYGLCDNIQDGVILHCFDWKYKDIEAELENIAEAGFTSIQTSPAQRNDSGTSEPWYMMYQPQNFAITTNPLGTKTELESLCQKAEEYGIKIVVDVVANHTRGMEGNNGPVDDNLKRSEFFRWNNIDSGSVNWQDRYQVYTCNIGMRDLVSENTDLQKIIAGYITELQKAGVDGIRWDAAKHMQLPSEGSQFWPAVTAQGLWHYGEILEGPNNGGNNNDNLMKEYTNYISVTDDVYGDQVLEGPKVNGNRTREYGFANGKVPTTIGNYAERGVSKDKLVYWAESHDTYSNNGEYGSNTALIEQNIVDRAYAVLAAQGKSTALYFSRPFQTNKMSIMPGVKGSTHYTSKEVAAVNHLHNACVGEVDYYVHDDQQNVAAVCRESGAVVVLGNGGNRDVTITNGGGTVEPGTYIDEVSGGEWTVTSTTMSGHVGDKGIAAFYKAEPVVRTPKPTISKEGGNFNDTLTLTIGLSNATSGTYRIGNGATETYTSSKQITIGSDMAFGDSVTITLTATDGSQTETKTYTFTKVDKVVNKAYLSLPSGWSEPVYCYAYDSATEAIDNGIWPGVKMTKDSSTGYYVYEIPENIEKPRVIFYSSDTNRYPADMDKGLLFETDGSYLYDGSWQLYTPIVQKGKVIVKYVDANGASVATQQTMEGNIGTQYTTTAAPVAGYRLKQTPSNASGTYTAADITVTYVYERESSNVLDVTSLLTDGAVFETETTTITLTTSNATSGTYSVDDGPVKTFSGSANVVIGQGKIADRDVTVKVTATNGTNTVNKTFTYKKKFNGNVINETAKDRQMAASASVTSKAAGGTTATDYYLTNPEGNLGSKKTVTKASDFTEADIIAQGVANDDPAIFRGSHEAPKFDMYAMYGAYDDTNIYIGIQYTNVIDVVDPAQSAPQTGRGKPNGADADIPQMLVFDTGSGDYTDGTTNDAKQKTAWGVDVKYDGAAKVDKIFMYSPKEGINNFAVFPVTNGLVDYDTAVSPGYQMPLAGASITWEDGFFGSNMYGIKDNGYSGYTPEALSQSSSKWVDFLNEGHSTEHDTFSIITLPLKYLGIDANKIASSGIGVMSIASYGASGIGCLPMDMTMLDNATDAYSQDDSTSAEKEDADIVTTALARLGGTGEIPPTPPTPPISTDPIVNFGADRSSPQLDTTNLTLEAIASSGTSPYQYEFFVDGVSVQSKSSADTYTWRPSKGSHTIKVTVTDSSGKTVSSQKAYVIEESGNIDPTDIKVSFKNEETKYVYNGQEQRPEIVVKDGTKTLVEGTDYSLTYANNVNAGDKDSANAPKVTIVGKGNYATKIETETLTFTIEKAEKPGGAPEGEMTVAVGPVTNLVLSAGWEWSDSSKNIVVQEGVTILAEAVYNGTDKENYKTTTVSVSLTGVSCNHVGTGRETIITLKATCTQAGRQNVICTKCHVTISEDEVIPALGHTGGTATCISQAICIRCGEKYGTFNSNNHVHTVVENKIEANCQQAGYTGDTKCKDCNTEISKGKPVSKIDHVWDAGTVTKAATATTDGVKTYTCKVCGGKKTETIPKTGGSTTEGPIVPVENPKVGDPVEDAASKGIYKVTKATSTVKTVEFTLPSSSVKDVTIPDKIVINGTDYQVTSIAGNAFKNNKTVQTVKMGSNIKTIGESAFSGCSNLKNVTLSKNTTTIGNMAFYKCTKLTSITIPSKVSKIGSKAFYGCSSLKKVTFSKNLTTIGSMAFYKCTKLTSITIPAKVSKIGSKAFYGCKKLKKITIKTTKLTSKKVGSQAFKGIASSATIKVPKTKLTSYKKILKAKGVGSKAKIKK